VALVSPPLLRLRGIGKRFGAVRALGNIDLDVGAGEAVAICGDNGAGKSTLIRIISGAEAASEGTMALDGAEMSFRSPAQALAAGIATTYQDLALAPRLSIAQNVFMGGELLRAPQWLGVLDKKRMRRAARDYLDPFGFSVTDMDRPVAELSGGQRQAVALARALRWQARIVIMDEPTAALGVAESRQVLDLIARLRARGVTVLLVSHNMDDVVAATERVVVLKRGSKIFEGSTADLDAGRLAHVITSGLAPAA
jgi:ABC-type sugar transport system ATPase subunit